MSWKYPKPPIKSGGIPDADAINEALLPAVEETFGQLNEHNWASLNQSAPNGGDPFVKEDVGAGEVFVYHSASSYSEFSDIAGGTVRAEDQKLAAWTDWTPLTGLTLSFSCPQTLLWIHGSCQIDQGVANISTSSMIKMAVRVDGQILLDSVTGGEEGDNDGVCGPLFLYHGLSTSFVLAVGAGEHTVDLVIKTVGIGSATSSTPAYVRSREIICMEMRR